MIDALPHDAIGLAGLAVIVSGPIITLLLQQRKQGRRIDDVHGQVHNNHDTNLRDDIDDISAGLHRLCTRLDEHIDECSLR